MTTPVKYPSRRESLYFVGPQQVEIRTEELPPSSPGQLLVETTVSAISAGTEMLFYRNQIPAGVPVDTSIPGFESDFAYPFKYGYAAVGRVIDHHPNIDPAWQNRRVFAFQPHQSHFYLSPANAIPIPPGVPDATAALLPTMETATTLVMDAQPILGERVLVIGLGVVGLLTTALLARFPLAKLIAIDPLASRRHLAEQWGAHQTLDPASLTEIPSAEPDLILELSGNPEALNLAIQIAGYRTRIVVGSWYGTKTASLALGNTFHRNRLTIITSQVSTLDPAFTGRWTKNRRLDVAWSMLQQIPVDQLITHRFPLAQSPQAYAQIDAHTDHTLQVLLTYTAQPTHSAKQESDFKDG